MAKRHLENNHEEYLILSDNYLASQSSWTTSQVINNYDPLIPSDSCNFDIKGISEFLPDLTGMSNEVIENFLRKIDEEAGLGEGNHKTLIRF